jgi:hypothetical protein
MVGERLEKELIVPVLWIPISWILLMEQAWVGEMLNRLYPDPFAKEILNRGHPRERGGLWLTGCQ